MERKIAPVFFKGTIARVIEARLRRVARQQFGEHPRGLPRVCHKNAAEFPPVSATGRAGQRVLRRPISNVLVIGRLGLALSQEKALIVFRQFKGHLGIEQDVPRFELLVVPRAQLLLRVGEDFNPSHRLPLATRRPPAARDGMGAAVCRNAFFLHYLSSFSNRKCARASRLPRPVLRCQTRMRAGHGGGFFADFLPQGPSGSVPRPKG